MGYKNPDKQRAYQREWIARRRREFFFGKSCAHCGSPGPLELDHIDPSTKVSHRIWSWSKARLQEEAAKCQVLCRDCHLTKTLEKFPLRGHGTLSRYRRGGCRCDLCRKANASRAREDRRKRAVLDGM